MGFLQPLLNFTLEIVSLVAIFHHADQIANLSGILRKVVEVFPAVCIANVFPALAANHIASLHSRYDLARVRWVRSNALAECILSRMAVTFPPKRLGAKLSPSTPFGYFVPVNSRIVGIRSAELTAILFVPGLTRRG